MCAYGHQQEYEINDNRKFWRNELIRLKYHNPAVPMSVDNKAPQEENAIMSIHFAPEGSKQTSNSATSSAAAVDSTTSSSSPSDAASTTRVETLNMTNYTNAEILEAFITLTKATPIEPDPEDLQELAEVEAERRRHNQEAARGAEIRQRKKREQELLEQARGMIA